MRNTALLYLFAAGLGVSGTAHAGLDLEDLGSVESVTLSSATTIPLYTTPEGQVYPCVQVTIGEEVYIFGLDLNHGIHVGERLVSELGLEPEEKKDRHFKEISTVEIEKMSLGALELSGVTALARQPDDNDNDPFYDTLPAGWSLDGYIGLASISEVAWSIQPSTGQVIFAPLAEGPELVSGLKDGETYTWRETEMLVERYGKNKIPVLAMAPIISVNVGGVELDALLSYRQWGSTTRSRVEGLSEGPTRHLGDQATTWMPVTLAEHAVDTWVETQGKTAGSFQLLSRPLFTQDYAEASVGRQVLTQFDIASDPSSNTLAIRYASEQQREDPTPFLLADATTDTEKMPEVPEGEAADPDAQAGSGAAFTRQAGLRWVSGDLAGAILSHQQRLEYGNNKNLCSIHQDIGEIQIEAGLLDEAIASLTTASDLYHAWWDQDLQTRKALEEILKEYEDDEAKAASEHADVNVQPGSCYTVDGSLAMAWLGQGDVEKVSALYAERLDLDENLALVQGNAALLDGNISLARAAFYQAVMLEGRPQSRSRIGQALIHESVGEWSHAEALYEKALEIDRHYAMAALLWVDASIRAKSAAATARATEAFLTANPDSSAAFIAHARALRLAGDDGQLRQLTRRGDAHYAARLRLYPGDGFLLASQSLFQVETGRLGEAQATAEAALVADPDATLAWLALGNIHVLTGDVSRGENMFKRAGQLGADSPAYALLINTDIPEPEPEPEPESELE
jgi:tetratricopeptide (TPR) repeat protein